MLTGRKLPLTLAFAVLVVLAFGASCNGFFTDPVLQSIALDPTSPHVEATKTLQMTAWGTFDDNSRKNISSSVSWSITSGDEGIATISATGLVTGMGAGSTTITASSQGISTTASLTVTLANLVSIAVTPQTASITSTKTQQFKATGTFSDNTTSDVTTQVTWASSNTNAALISNTSGAQGLATAATVTSQQTTNITATSGSATSNVAVLTVNP
jgi:hypothetical protein